MTSGQFRTLAMFFGKVWKIVYESENNENSLFSTVVAYRWTWTFSGKTFIRWVFFFTKLGTSCDPFNWKALNKSCNSSALYTVQSDFLSQRKNSKNYIFLTAEAIIDGHEHFLEGHSSDESLFLSKNLQRKRKHPSREEILLLNLANPLRNWIAKHFDWKRPWKPWKM